MYAWYETVGGALNLLQLLYRLWKLNLLDMSFAAINLIFRCCIDKALDADENAIKTVNLYVKSLSDNCELSEIFDFK